MDASILIRWGNHSIEHKEQIETHTHTDTHMQTPTLRIIRCYLSEQQTDFRAAGPGGDGGGGGRGG